jgi:hypothetical protein
MKALAVILILSITFISGCMGFTDPQPIYDKYDCSSNVYNCADFNTYEKALEAFVYCGGMYDDVHHLDGDNDGIPCESLR